MKNLRWRFTVFLSGIIFLAAFLFSEVLLRLGSVDDPEQIAWAMGHNLSHWALLLVLGAFTHAVFIFGPLQLPFIAVWMRRQPPSPLAQSAILILPTLVISGALAAYTWAHRPDSKGLFTDHLKRPIPPAASHYMAIHPIGIGTLASFWGSVHGFRMQIPLRDATHFCEGTGGALYDFPVESLAEPYDSFIASLPRSWGYSLGQPQLRFHQLPPICGKPAFAIVDPERNEMLVLFWHGQ